MKAYQPQRNYWLTRITLKARDMGLEGDAYRLTLLALVGSESCEGLEEAALEGLYQGLTQVARASGREDYSAAALEGLLT